MLSILRAVAPLLAVARAYRREVVRRPGFLGLLVVAVALLILARTFDLFGFGQERNLVEQQMLETIALTLTALVLLFGAGAVGRDLETRSALLLLAKPVSRATFLVGRFLGLAQACTFAAAPLWVLSVVLLGLGEQAAPVAPAEGAALAQGAALALAQALALAGAVLLLSTLFPPPLVLPLAVGVTVLGLLAEPLRASLGAGIDGGAAGLLPPLLRVVALLTPPLHEPASAAAVAFEGGLAAPIFLVRLGRALVYALAALAAASIALGRKDLT